MSWRAVGMVFSAVLLVGCQSTTTSASGGSSSTRPSSTARAVGDDGGVQAYVTATVDGDTFRADVDGRSQRIRVLGIIH